MAFCRCGIPYPIRKDSVNMRRILAVLIAASLLISSTAGFAEDLREEDSSVFDSSYTEEKNVSGERFESDDWTSETDESHSSTDSGDYEEDSDSSELDEPDGTADSEDYEENSDSFETDEPDGNADSEDFEEDTDPTETAEPDGNADGEDYEEDADASETDEPDDGEDFEDDTDSSGITDGEDFEEDTDSSGTSEPERYIDASYFGEDESTDAIVTVEHSESASSSEAAADSENGEEEQPDEETTEPTSRKVRVAILSDIHYVLDNTTNEAGAKNLEEAANTEMRLMQEIDGILSAALDEASGVNPDVLLVCGDLLSNGEQSGALALSERLKTSREKEGLKNAGIYVVNGNHDINNSYAADFSGDTIEGAKRVQPSEFAEIFAGLGYGEDDHCEGGSHSVYVPSDDPSVVANHGGLSYAADIAEGITLIVLDTAIYRTDADETSRYNEAQQTASYVTDDLLNWAAEQARAAKEKGNLVLAMSHHGLMPHYSTTEEQAWYMDSFRAKNWETVADTLADAGVTAVLTGHTHANDIAKHVSKNNNVLYDIETAALSAYPCAWRTLDIEINGEGDEKTYTFSIDSSLIDGADIPGDTSSWSFTIDGKEKTFQDDYNSNLQDFAYEKTSFNDTTLPLVANYMIKNMLYDIVNGEDGLNGYLRRTLNLQEGQTLGEWAVASIQNVVKQLNGFSQNFSIFGTNYKIRLDETEAESPLMPTFDVMFHPVPEQQEQQEQQEEQTEEQPEENDGKLTFDLTYIATAANEFVQKVQQKLEEGDWLNNNYGSAPLLDDLNTLVQKAVLPSMDKPLEEDDPESTASKILSHAWQTFAAGDEAKQDAEEFAHERELLTGETLTESLRKDVWTEVVTLDNEYDYPVISKLMEQRIVEEGKDTATIVQPRDASSDYAAYGGLLFSHINTLSNVLMLGKWLSIANVNIIPAKAVQSIEQKLVDLHETLTVDKNIPEDNQWSFQAVRFDANGGDVEQSHGLTVEDHRLVNLPVPAEREDFVFDGWFTELDGGRQVTADEDMTGIDTLYAHWTYIGEPGGNDEGEDPEVPDDPEDPDDPYEPVEPIDFIEIDGSDDESDDSNNATTKTTSKAAEADLHDRFGSRAEDHEHIASVEYALPAHVQFCAAVADSIRNGETLIDMASWLSLDAQAVSAIEASNVAITITFAGMRVVIPAGASLHPYADRNNSVCLICLAEAFGYEAL